MEAITVTLSPWTLNVIVFLGALHILLTAFSIFTSEKLRKEKEKVKNAYIELASTNQALIKLIENTEKE